MLFNSRWTPTKHSFASPSSGSLAEQASVFGLRSSPSATSTSPHRKILVLLHGYPQNHTLWFSIAEELEAQGILDEWDVLIPDLPGYGQSTKTPSPDGSHLANCKRGVAADIVAWIDSIYPGENVKFVITGHDRGARVSYRLAKDFRERVAGLCVMDIVPTQLAWDNIRAREPEVFRTYHWIFLAMPTPLPETLIAPAYQFYFRYTIDSWTGSRKKGKLNEEATNEWIEQYKDSNVLQGSLEDYRAGATIDLQHDAEDVTEGKEKVDCPVLTLYSTGLRAKIDLREVWEKLTNSSVTASAVGDEGVGHFFPVEEPKETATHLIQWLKTL